PYGASAVFHVGAVRDSSAGLIREWNHPGFGSAAQTVGVIALAAAVVGAWLSWRLQRPEMTGILLALGVGTASAIRFGPMVAVASAPVFAAALSRLEVRPVMARRILALGCVLVAGMAINETRQYRHVDQAGRSPALVDVLPAGCRLVNDYDIGGMVLLARPDVLVSLDGRNDMYGRNDVIAAVRMLAYPRRAIPRMDAHGVDCVLAQTQWPLVKALSKDPRWQVAATDSVRTLLVRRQA
ncbi:MAG TPA: hypothetical protein VE441_05665, partial [Mycobacterium sp.]|nr:hypothetical protein [Mycobacterium sp.]